MKRKETTKNSTKKRIAFSFFKKHKSLTLSLVIIIMAVGSFLVVNYGRYVKDLVHVYYLRTKNFYFNSDKLTLLGKTYQINPWSGSTPYDIDINMSSLLNSIKGSDSDINYTVSCAASDDYRTDNPLHGNVKCALSNNTQTENRVIYASSHTDNFVVTVSLLNGIRPSPGDEFYVDITATATSPYEETLKARFVLVIGEFGVDYKIEDEPGRLYADSIVSYTYPDEDPNTSIRVRLEITDTDKFSIDMNNIILNDPETVKEYDSARNIKAIVFNVKTRSSMAVRFYKNDSSVSYSCIGTNCPNITFSRVT